MLIRCIVLTLLCLFVLLSVSVLSLAHSSSVEHSSHHHTDQHHQQVVSSTPAGEDKEPFAPDNHHDENDDRVFHNYVPTSHSHDDQQSISSSSSHPPPSSSPSSSHSPSHHSSSPPASHSSSSPSSHEAELESNNNKPPEEDRSTQIDRHGSDSIFDDSNGILQEANKQEEEDDNEKVHREEAKSETMNVNDDSSSPPTGGSLLDDLYEHSLRFYSYMAQALHHNDQNAPADSPPSSSNTGSPTEFDFYTLMSQPYRIETLASSCALFICILIYAICHVRPDSICSKYLRYVNVLAVFTLLITALGSCFKFLVKTPENVEIQISSDNSGAYSMQGRRGGMEDRFTLKNSIASELGMEFYAVYDGHGGPNAAAYAQKELFNRITRRVKLLITEPTSTENPVSKLKARTPLKEVKNLLTRMTSDVSRFDLLNVNDLKNIINDEVISFDEKLVNEFTAKQDISGTTALIVVRIVKTNTLLVANVGDSRAILCDWKNATIPLSFDHKPDKLKEYRRVMEAGGHIILRGVFRVNGILAVSRALGDYPLKNNRIVIPDPDILTFDLDDLRPRFMIIASDGFWDTFSNENAVQYVKNELTHYGTNYVAKGSGSLAIQIAKKLAQESYNRESYDNITVIVVLFEEQDGKARVGIAKKTK